MATALYQAGTRCAAPDAVCTSAASGGAASGLMIGGRSVAVLAAYTAATAHDGECAAIGGSVGLRAKVAHGVSVLRPLDVRASLGGPLPLLPLIELVAASAPVDHGRPRRESPAPRRPPGAVRRLGPRLRTPERRRCAARTLAVASGARLSC